MAEVHNKERAERARKGLRQYLRQDPYDPQSCLVYCLADLRHYAHQNGLSFRKAALSSAMHFAAETVGGED